MSTQRYALQARRTSRSRKVNTSYPVRELPAARWIRRISIGYLALMLMIWLLISFYSEDWWISAIFLYLPRLPYLVPAAILLCASLWFCRKIALVNLATIAFILFPLMGFAIPVNHLLSEPVEGEELRIVSCNVQRYQPSFASVLQEIAWKKPDLIALQEAPDTPPMIQDYFKDWYTIEFDEYWVGSKYPIKLVKTCKTAAFDRISAIAVEVSMPTEKIMLFNVHQTTARAGMTELDVSSLFSGEGQAFLDNYIFLRTDEAMATREFIQNLNPEIPRIIVGDFNAPSESSVYQNAWGDLTNCFDTAGWGYGYTSPVKKHNLWLDNTPWMKIDHILTGNRWEVKESAVGKSSGSDHHMVSAGLILKKQDSETQKYYSEVNTSNQPQAPEENHSHLMQNYGN